MREHMTQIALNSKWEHISNVINKQYSQTEQHIHIKTQKGSRNHAVASDIIKTTFNFDIESRDKTCSIIYNVGRALMEKIVLLLGSKEIHAINNSDIYHTYKDLYLSEEDLAITVNNKSIVYNDKKMQTKTLWEKIYNSFRFWLF